MGKNGRARSDAPSPERATVVGSGPNGLAAAIVLAQRGLPVEVHEAQSEPGGAVRTMPLTLPGFLNDFGSAVYPLGPGSPFFRTLPLQEHGLRWLHHPTPVAHPLDDGTAVTLERDPAAAREELGRDGDAWWGMVAPLVEQWEEFSKEAFIPVLHVPRHPFLMARFAALAATPARFLASVSFRTERSRALFAGLAAHSFLSLDQPFSSAAALVLGAAAHAVGWPIAEGGASSITRSLEGVLAQSGGVLRTSAEVRSLQEFPDDALTFFDTLPDAMLRISGDRLPPTYAQRLQRFRRGPGSFKIDYALREPIPWKAAACKRAGTVHLGGTLAEITRGERAVTRGRISERPFVLLAQPSLVDPTRAPAGQHTAWAYCHVPFASAEDATEAIEAQIERFAPGFREVVLARSIASPARLESLDANLVGGDISGGAMDVAQLFFRPTARGYETPDPLLWLCSSSTPPGGGVHGMCGWNAAQAALRKWRL